MPLAKGWSHYPGERHLRSAVDTAPLEGLSKRMRSLTALAGLLAVLTILDDLDQLRQGPEVIELYVVAVIALASTDATAALLVRRHPLCTMAATTLGLATALGVGVVHAAPARSFLSDSYPAADADALSWAIILAMTIVGFVIAVWAGTLTIFEPTRAPSVDAAQGSDAGTEVDADSDLARRRSGQLT